MPFSFALAVAVQVSVCYASSVSVHTTSGILRGIETNGLLTLKGIRFAQPPTGPLRWEPPVAFTSATFQNATVLGPSCVQQFPFATAAIDQQLFNTPPALENEDCLFLNVWAPAQVQKKLPVLIWIYGGGFAFGTAGMSEYDGASIASNQNIVVVSFNYRTNVFGFPELAFEWVQQNIAKVGGDPKQVTIMGQSAGSESVAAAISRHSPSSSPFRGGIMLSAAQESTVPTPSFASDVPAVVIRTFVNGPSGGLYVPIVDNVTFFADPFQRIRTGLTARVPFIIGNTENDGSIFALNLTNLTEYLATNFGPFVTADEVRALYPSGLGDNAVISELTKDLVFLCPAELWAGSAVGAGVTDIYRYTYGAVFADLQLFPDAGAWHTSELPEIFGTFNRSTATQLEAELSHTMQRLVANFVKNPAVAPAPNWPKYLAYNGNIGLGNVVQVAQSDSLDGPCDALWNQFLDVRV
ncbi:Alpha/Beta hydrolase protein [Mycena olivaceomarginata]|nr:Alpha/Beta hydrolase protein [Mycena olivaceomarginata]